MAKLQRYPGFSPFSVSEEAIFFGRTEDIERLYTRINIEQLVVLFSKSGLGKSSLINAGIIPKILKENKFVHYHLQSWDFQENSGIMPLDKIKAFISKEGNSKTFLDNFTEESHTLWHLLKNQQISTGISEYLLILDQFEQLFYFPQQAIKNFTNEIAELLNIRVPAKYLMKLEESNSKNSSFVSKEELKQLYEPLNIKILIAIRSDMISLMDSLKDKLPNILNVTYPLLPLDEMQAKDALMKPAEKTDLDFEKPSFQITNDAFLKIKTYLTKGKENEFESFQLQAICQYIEKKVSDKKRIIEDTDLGDLDFVFKNLYESLINTIKDHGDKSKVRVLIEDGLISEADKRRKSLYEGEILKTYQIPEKLLKELVNSRFIRRSTNPLGGFAYELAHDSLIEPVLESREKRIHEEVIRKNQERLEDKRREEEKKRLEEHEKFTLRQKQKYSLRIALISAISTLVFIFLAVVANSAREKAVIIGHSLKIRGDSLRNANDLSEKRRNEILVSRDELKLLTNELHLKNEKLTLANLEVVKQNKKISYDNSELRKKDQNISNLNTTLSLKKDTIEWQKNISEVLVKEAFPWLKYLSNDLKNYIVESIVENKTRGKEHRDNMNKIELAAFGKIEENRNFFNALGVAKLVHSISNSEVIKNITSTYVKNICFPQQIIGFKEPVLDFDLSPDGKTLVFTKNSTSYLFKLDLDKPTKVDSIKTNFRYGISDFQFIPKTNNILITSKNHEQPLIYSKGGNLVAKVSLKRIKPEIRNIIMDAKGEFAGLFYMDGRVSKYDLRTRKETMFNDKLEKNTAIYYTDYQEYYLSRDNLNIKDRSGKNILPKKWIISDNKLLYVSPYDDYVITSKGNIIYKTVLNDKYNPELDKAQKLDKTPNRTALTIPSDTITAIDASKNETFLATGSKDNTIIISNLTTSNINVITLIGQQAPVSQLKFVQIIDPEVSSYDFPDPKMLVSLSVKGELIIWDLTKSLSNQDLILNSRYIQIGDLFPLRNEYMNLKDTVMAVECYRLAAEVYPADGNSWYDLGYAYLVHKQDTLNAMRSFRVACKMNSQSVDALNGMGLTNYYFSAYDSAIYYLDMAIKIKPDYVYPYRNRAYVNLELEKFEAAATDFDFMIQHSMNAPTLSDLIAYGDMFYVRARYNEAMHFYKKAAGSYPSEYLAYYKLGQAHLKKKEYKDASTNYIMSYRKFPSVGLSGIDSIYKQSKDTSLVLQVYHNLIKEFPKNAVLLDVMGQFQFNVARYDSALWYEEQSNRFGYRTNYEKWANIGWYKLFIKDYTGAIDADNKALNSNKIDESTRIMTLINMAHAYFLLRNFDKAKEIYNKYKNTLWENRIIKDVVAEDFGAFIAADLTDKEIGNEMNRIITSFKNQ
jgi:tetratricopeptide (TPR) repeat protein